MGNLSNKGKDINDNSIVKDVVDGNGIVIKNIKCAVKSVAK